MAIELLKNQEYSRREIRDIIIGLGIRDTAWQAGVNTTLLAVAGVAVLGYFAWRAGFFKGVIK